MSIARLDLRTEEGQAAYQAFMSGGQMPAWSPPGVLQAGTTEVLNAEHTARFGVPTEAKVAFACIALAGDP